MDKAEGGGAVGQDVPTRRICDQIVPSVRDDHFSNDIKSIVGRM